jgi:hypothetical protein
MKRSASTAPAAIRGAMRAYWFGPAEFLGHGDRLNSEGAYTPVLKTKNTDGTVALSSAKKFYLKTRLQSIITNIL